MFERLAAFGADADADATLFVGGPTFQRKQDAGRHKCTGIINAQTSSIGLLAAVLVSMSICAADGEVTPCVFGNASRRSCQNSINIKHVHMYEEGHLGQKA